MFQENGCRHNDPATQENFSFPQCQLDLRPNFSLGTGGLFPPSIQQPGSEADHSHMHVAVWCIIKHRDKFTWENKWLSCDNYQLRN